MATEFEEKIAAAQKQIEETLSKTGEVEPAPETIEISDSLGVTQDEPEEAPKPQPRTQNRKDNLVAQKTRLYNEKKEWEVTARNLAQRAAELEEQLEQRAARETALAEQNFKLREAGAQELLSRALEKGDAVNYTEMQQFMAKLAVEKAMYDQQQNQNRAQYTNYQEPVYQEEVASSNPYFDEWVSRDENSWYENDPELRAEADHLAKSLSKSYHMSGRSHEIGSTTFFNDVGQTLRSQYSAPAQVQVPRGRPNLAPVARTPSAGAVASNNSGRTYKLTSEEISIADGIPRYAADGRTPLSKEEKRIAYARNKYGAK